MTNLKLFGTDGIRGNASKYPFDEESLIQVGKAITTHFRAKKIFISGDSRRSTPKIMKDLIKGITSQNCDVLFVDIMPTPFISYLTKVYDCDCGIVITASHNPWNENGIKLFSSLGKKLSEEEELKIENLILNETFNNLKQGQMRKIDNWQTLIEQKFKNQFDFKTTKRIVIDCGHGATSYIAKKIFKKHCKDIITINCEPNGYNINDGGSTNLKDLKFAVISNNADVGIAFDGDGDRVIMLDEKAHEIDGDHIMGIIASTISDDKVVLTSYSNLALMNYLKNIGKEPIITENGDKFVYLKMKELNLQLGGEKTGHILLPKYSTTGDGITSALKILEILNEKKCKLSKLNPFIDLPQVLINKEIIEKTPITELTEVQEKIKEVETLLGNQGRVHVRYSGTQNLVRVMVEGPEENVINKYANQILDLFR